jgi:hypothetical protein
MKKIYHVFAGSQYYPTAHCGDLLGSYETEEEARQSAKESESDWSCIFNGETGEVIPFYKSND